MRILRNDTDASAWPIVIFIIALAFTSVVILLLGHVIEPFLNLMSSSDDTIDESVSAPRMAMASFFQILWPKGLLLTILFGLAFALFFEYQKQNYKEM